MSPTTRRAFIATSLALLAMPRVTAAQRAGKPYRVVHLSGSGEVASKPFADAFLAGMKALGYVEGQTFTFEQRYAEGKNERLPALAQELVRTNPDLILSATTPGSLAAKAATSTIPIVFVLVADPLGAGLVPSLAHPGGNVTGITNIVAELAGKRLEILREIVPSAARFAVFVNKGNPNAPLQMKYAEAAAKQLGVELEPVADITTPADLPKAFDAAVKARAGGALRMIDPLVFMLRKETAALAVKHHLPVIFPTREDVETGGLVAYGANTPDQFRLAATLVDKIRRGAKPADLPVEQPTKFELVLNAKTAKAIGVTVPPSLLLRADQIIE
jgi:putative ABC transport system substrate-binding protein